MDELCAEAANKYECGVLNLASILNFQSDIIGL
jgi:hypothetical protein